MKCSPPKPHRFFPIQHPPPPLYLTVVKWLIQIKSFLVVEQTKPIFSGSISSDKIRIISNIFFFKYAIQFRYCKKYKIRWNQIIFWASYEIPWLGLPFDTNANFFSWSDTPGLFPQQIPMVQEGVFVNGKTNFSTLYGKKVD